MRSTATIFAAAIVFASTLPVHAQRLPDTLAMSCAQAQAMVRSNGAIVLATGPNLYDRYVTGQNFCNREQEARPAWVRSADNPQCFIGNRCVEVDFSVR